MVFYEELSLILFLPQHLSWNNVGSCFFFYHVTDLKILFSICSLKFCHGVGDTTVLSSLGNRDFRQAIYEVCQHVVKGNLRVEQVLHAFTDLKVGIDPQGCTCSWLRPLTGQVLSHLSSFVYSPGWVAWSHLRLLLHCDSIITRLSGSTWKSRVIKDCVIYTRLLFKIFNAASFTGFHISKQMPHPPSFRMGHQSVYLLYGYNTQTFHKPRYQ